MLHSSFTLVTYFTRDSVYIHVNATFSVCPVSPSLAVSTSPFSLSAPLFLLWKWSDQYYFSRFHTYALIYDICSSLSDLLNSVLQALGSSLSLKLTQILSFYGCIIFHWVYVSQLLYLFICQWTCSCTFFFASIVFAHNLFCTFHLKPL